jgi:hypothetical protein
VCHNFYMWLAGLLLLAFAQQDPGVLFRQKDIAGWMALGEDSQLQASADGMTYTYDVGAKKFSGAVLSAPPDFARMRSVRFSLKSDHDTAMAVLLTEKKPGGGNYAAWFWAPANVRQQIELTPTDFTVTDGLGDPVDADGKLDLDQVEGIGIVDLAQFQLARPRTADTPATPVSARRHTFTIADFAITGGPGSAPAAERRGDAALDSFDRGFLDWVAVGGMRLQLSSARDPLGAPAMQASYRQKDGQLELLVRRVGNPALASARHLSFDIASEREVTLVVALEMKKPGGSGGEGPRFSLPIYPPGGREVFHVDLNLADFKGPTGTFDPSQWRTIAIMDATEPGGTEPENTIWIGKMEARD